MLKIRIIDSKNKRDIIIHCVSVEFEEKDSILNILDLQDYLWKFRVISSRYFLDDLFVSNRATINGYELEED